MKLSWRRARTRGDASPVPQVMGLSAKIREIKNAIRESAGGARGTVTIVGTHASVIVGEILVKKRTEKTLGNVEDPGIGATREKSADIVGVIDVVILLTAVIAAKIVEEALAMKTTENGGNLPNLS